MTIYILNLLVIGLTSFFYNIIKSNSKDKLKLKKFFIFIISIQLILILSLRHSSIGVDTKGYISYFKYIFPHYDLIQLMDHRHELGYKLLNRIIGIFTNNEQIFLTIIAFLSIAPVGRFIYKNSKMPFLSFCLYISMNYYSFTFSGLRQAIAYAIILSSYEYIKGKNLIKFIICVLFATLFHKSALVFLPAYFLANLKINKVTISGILIFDFMVYVFRKQIFLVLANTFYDAYELVETSSFTWMLLCTLIIIFGLFFYKNVVSVSKENNALYIYLIIGVSIMIFASTGTNIMRIADYYYMYVILFIPEVMNVIRDKRLVLTGGYILIICIFTLYIWFLLNDGFQIVPYKFFWSYNI